MTTEVYDGPVCYLDGWHHAIEKDDEGNDAPGARLVLEDATIDGEVQSRYRVATDDDTRSWHERKHQKFVTIEMEDAAPGARVTPEEFEAIQELLASLRGGQ